VLATGPVPGAKFNYAPAPPDILERARRLDEVCRAHDVPLPAAAIAFALAHPVVKQVILGARTVDQQAQNLAWLNTDIPAALWSDCRQAGLVDDEAPTPETAAHQPHPSIRSPR
jgi:D-threo-aldose 1-dehydrogenase